MLSVIMHNVTHNPFVLNVVMLSVVGLNVVMLSVMEHSATPRADVIKTLQPRHLTRLQIVGKNALAYHRHENKNRLVPQQCLHF
jgi:hypothetical protein